MIFNAKMLQYPPKFDFKLMEIELNKSGLNAEIPSAA